MWRSKKFFTKKIVEERVIHYRFKTLTENKIAFCKFLFSFFMHYISLFYVSGNFPCRSDSSKIIYGGTVIASPHICDIYICDIHMTCLIFKLKLCHIFKTVHVKLNYLLLENFYLKMSLTNPKTFRRCQEKSPTWNAWAAIFKNANFP